MSPAASTALLGARRMAPIAAGGIPFGLIAGVSAGQIGFGPWEAVGISVGVFAGAAQLATYDLLAKGAPLAVVFVAAVLINLRFALYSAAIASYFDGTSRKTRAFLAYLLTDQAYALCAARQSDAPEAPHPVAYYLGAACTLWVMWSSTTLIGASAGASIPSHWPLGFAVPLCFLALLAPAVRSRPQLIVVVVTGAVALAARNAPHGLGVIASIVAGIGTGVLLERYGMSESPEPKPETGSA